MNENERYEKLNDYVDGVLSDAEARAIEAELARDPAFREEERALRALLGEAHRLPKGVAPRCDLWGCIESQLCERVCARTESATKTFQLIYRASLAAAAAVVIFAAGMWYARNGVETPAQTQQVAAVNTPVETQSNAATGIEVATDATANQQQTPNENDSEVDSGMEFASYREIEVEYAAVREALREKLDEVRPNLAPETIEVVDDSLVTIDNAIKEIESALAKDPGNHGLIRSLVAVYDQEVGLLRQVSRVAQLPAENNA
ncbi:MAG: hypothetical protein IT366_09635 [Candidatus Hydrogenedentes bacterium]|nr:hypothetical protein [Candidatus Hydrogenedentota bacterium]